MRNNQLKKIVGFFVMLCSFTIRAQLSNGGFEANCGANAAMGGLCSTFANGCIPGWFTTHGTPQLIATSGFEGTASMMMWAAQGQGEGVGINIGTALIPGREYSLCFAYRVSNPENLAASLRVRLTSGLAHVAATTCGGTPPTATFQEISVIGISTSSGWAAANITFIANAAHTQIIVFPSSGAVQNANPATVIVDDFRLAGHCANTMLISQTSPSISESFEQWGIIRAGSHVNGSTTTSYVTVDQPGLVVFGAAQFVSLEENFLAIPGAGDEAFLAIIEDCNTLCRILLPRQSEEFLPFPANTDWDIMNGKGTITVFPNPASDQVTVYSSQGLKSVALSDVSGRTIRVFQPAIDEKQHTFSVSDIKSGIYLLMITDNSGKTETKKLVVE
jgi:hypothetical protein